jgi:hypothetical protein
MGLRRGRALPWPDNVGPGAADIGREHVRPLLAEPVHFSRPRSRAIAWSPTPPQSGRCAATPHRATTTITTSPAQMETWTAAGECGSGSRASNSLKSLKLPPLLRLQPLPLNLCQHPQQQKPVKKAAPPPKSKPAKAQPKQKSRQHTWKIPDSTYSRAIKEWRMSDSEHLGEIFERVLAFAAAVKALAGHSPAIRFKRSRIARRRFSRAIRIPFGPDRLREIQRKTT